jgi:hypothetical protein
LHFAHECRNAGAILPEYGIAPIVATKKAEDKTNAPSRAPAQRLFIKGEAVTDGPGGDEGVVAEDQNSPGALVKVDFYGQIDELDASVLVRIG